VITPTTAIIHNLIMKAKNENKYILERHFYDRFLALHDEFPKKEPEKSEAPDFLIKIDKKVIGVEITQIHNEPNKGEFLPAQKHALEDKILSKAQKLFFDRNQIHLHVSFHFIDHFQLSGKQVETLIIQICKVIEEKIKGEGLNHNFSFSIIDGLPQELVVINGDYFPNITDTIWYSAKGIWLPNLSKQQIITIINKKEKEIITYKKKASALILLIVEGVIPNSWFDKVDKPEASEIESEFEKIFILRYLSNKLIEIK
jgi:hypothetical protein